VLSGIFVMETVLKLIAHRPRQFIKSKWDIFDTLITLPTLAQAILLITGVKETEWIIAALVTLRVTRIFRLARTWPAMRYLLRTLIFNMSALIYVNLMMVIFIYIFAVLGQKMFRDAYRKKFTEMPRFNFDNFESSCMMIFRIMCGEWIQPLGVAVKATSSWAIVFFLMVFLIGNLLVLNLFVALILSTLEDQSFQEKYNTENDSHLDQNFMHQLKSIFTSSCCFKKESGNSYTSSDDIFGKKGDISVSHCLPDCIGEKFSKCIKVDSSSYQAWIAARKMIQKWMTHWVYNLLMILLIMASSILLAMEDKRAVQNPPYWYNIRLAESIVTLIFIVTIIFEIFARGISQYFSNGWNVLDFTVIVVMMLSSKIIFLIFHTSRTTKAIGPLRVIRRVQSIKMMFLAILESIPKIMNVFLVCMVFWYIFAVSGIYFFGGKFFRCIYVSNSSLVDSALVGDKDSCKGNDYKWTNSLIHFDDFPQAIILLFHVATFDGWKRALYNAVDARGINLQPVTYYNPAAHGYFVAFIIIGVFVALNLIVGVIIDGFYLERQQSGSALEAYLTDSQRRWYRMMRKLLKTKPKKSIPRGNHQWQIRLRKFVENPKFEMTVIYIIVANVIVMMVTHYHESNEVHEVLDILFKCFNYFFTIFYVIEAVLKIIVFRLYYFKDAWNLFDFAVVILSISGMIPHFCYSTTANTTINPSTIRILRIFRIVRILRLVQYAQGIRRLLISLAMSAPALLNIGMLTFLVIFIYAVLGMSVFYNVKHTGVLTNVFNFDDFFNSLIVLFQLMTAAGWTDVSSALSIESPNCNSNDTTISPFGNCGNRSLSLLFTSSYVYLTWLVLSNLFVAVILSNYQDVVDTEAGGVTEMDIDIFYEVWAKYDTEATQFIDYSSLSPLVADIKPPLGVPQPNRYACIALDLPLYRSNRLHCLDIIEALLFRIIGNPADSDEELTAEFDILIRRIKKSFLKKFPSRVPANQINRISELEKANITAAIVIQRAYRKWRFKKVVNDRVERHQLVYRNVANRCEKKPQKGILKKIRNARNVNNA
ncbi:uncharacterized protein TRIADDRAFT_22006, partial [Trichoplax adhaerens]